MIDLMKVRKYEERFEARFTPSDVSKLQRRRLVTLKYFDDTKSSCDLMCIPNNEHVYFFVGNFLEDDGRVFYHMSAKFSNGIAVDKSFWNYARIPVMPLIDFQSIKEDIRISVSFRVGIYEGGGTIYDWQTVFTSIEDFCTLSTQANFQSLKMHELLESGEFSDVTLVCADDMKIEAHKCLLLASPYFRALLSENFNGSQKSVINVDYNYSSIKILLSYLYTGGICQEKVKNWNEVFTMASFYGVEELSRYCELQIMTRTGEDLENIKEVLRFAVRFDARKLRKYITKLVRRMQETEGVRDVD